MKRTLVTITKKHIRNGDNTDCKRNALCLALMDAGFHDVEMTAQPEFWTEVSRHVMSTRLHKWQSKMDNCKTSKERNAMPEISFWVIEE